MTLETKWPRNERTVSQTSERQCILSQRVDANGNPYLFSWGAGLVLTVEANSTPLIVTAANGYDKFGNVDRVGICNENVDIPLNTGLFQMIYADIAPDGSLTFGSNEIFVDFPELNQKGEAHSTAAGIFSFNTKTMIGKLGNGTTADQKYRVILGMAITSGGNIIFAFSYSTQNQYDSGDIALLAGVSQSYSLSAPMLGDSEIKFYLVNKTGTNGYTVGDRVNPDIWYAPGFYTGIQMRRVFGSPNATVVSGPAGTSGFIVQTFTAPYGVLIDAPHADWDYCFTAKRLW